MADDTPIGSFVPLVAPGPRGDNTPATGGDNTPVGSFQPILSTSFQKVPTTDNAGSVWGDQAHKLGVGTRDVMEGASSPVTGVLDLLTWPGRALSRAAGLPTTAPSDLVTKTLDAAGLPQPATPTEQNISTFNRGAAATLPSLAFGGAPSAAAMVPRVVRPFVATPTASVPEAARLLLQGGVGAVAGEKAAADERVPEWLKPTANIAGAIAGARFADATANLGAKTVNAVRGQMSPVYDAFVRAGVDPRLLGTVAGGELGQSFEAGTTRMPFASSIMRPAQQQTVDQFGNSVERTAAQIDPTGASLNEKTTGEHLQNTYRNWVDNVFNGPQGRQETAWAPLNQRMAGASVDASPFRSALTDAAKPPNLASLPETQKAWASGQAQRWLDALNTDIGRGNLTWEQAQAIRSRIGDAMGTPGIADAVGMQQLRRMYGGLAQGMENSAVANGQGALFRDANAVTTEGHAFIENVGRKIAKANNPLQETVDAEDATKNILQSNDTTMQAVRRELPDAADTVAAFKLRQAQTAKPSVAGAYDDTSTGSFLSNMNRMRQKTPGGYNALFNTPTAQGQLNDLTEVARRLRATERHLNTSGTAEQLGWMAYLSGLTGAIGSGHLGAIALAAGGPPAAGVGLGKLMTSPLATRLAAARGMGPGVLPSGTGGLLGAIPGATGQPGGPIPTITVRPQPGQ